MARRRLVDLEDMTDEEVRSLVADASRRERWMPGGYSPTRRRWTAMRIRGETELARRGLDPANPS
jgi:hypothetical protein